MCAEYIGSIVSPNLLIALIKPSLFEGNQGSFRILSAAFRSTPPKNLQTDLDHLVEVLRFSNIKEGLSSLEQDEMLHLMQRLFSACHFERCDVDFLFTLYYLVHIKSSSDRVAEKEMASTLLEGAAKAFNSKSKEEFIADHMRQCLTRLKETPPWNSEVEKEIFVFFFLSKNKGKLELDKYFVFFTCLIHLH